MTNDATHLACLAEFTTDQLADWIVRTGRTDEHQLERTKAAVMTLAKAGDLPDQFIANWIEANREAARRNLAEADELRQFAKMRAHPH